MGQFRLVKLPQDAWPRFSEAGPSIAGAGPFFLRAPESYTTRGTGVSLPNRKISILIFAYVIIVGLLALLLRAMH